jgi:hypothetical protein
MPEHDVSLPAQGDSKLPEWEHTATVTIRTTAHVRLKGRGPHPDFVDWEHIGLDLDKRVERDGHLPPDLVVDYVSVDSENRGVVMGVSPMGRSGSTECPFCKAPTYRGDDGIERCSVTRLPVYNHRPTKATS